jgi:uncharacterized damage-inducible protein DinB
MSQIEAFMKEFEAEMANTRRTLERVPQDRLGWKPHPKSGTMGWLASHIADIPAWVSMILNQDSVDVAPLGEEPKRTVPASSIPELLAKFDNGVEEARRTLAACDDSILSRSWSLLFGGQVAFTEEKGGVLRGFVMNHAIHHRAQLCVYLRLNDVPVPALYGPSADESGR